MSHLLPIAIGFVSRIRRGHSESGQTLVEYGLLVALIAVVAVAALVFIGPIVSQMFQNIADNLNV
jgi:pilus assembly protein Flp/PilA